MSERVYDVAVLGLGAMGSAAVYQLAKRGVSVIGLDRFTPPHDRGSSHGESRIIREAYWEHPSYVPLIDRAYALWAETERESGTSLYLRTGAVLVGVPDGEMIPGARDTARQHNLPHEELSAAEVRRRYPALQPSDDFEAIFEPRAGVLYPERCIEAHLALARKHGADIRLGYPVTSWTSGGSGVRLTSPNGQVRARHLVLAGGPWMPGLLGSVGARLWVERQVLYWFRPKTPDRFAPKAFPVYAVEWEKEKLFYGFPELGSGAKVALHHQGEPADPEVPRRAPDAAEVQGMRGLLARYLPDLNGELLRSATCLYTNAPDLHFVIDRHPDHDNVTVASPCGGHGFKYASVVGEILADLATNGATPHDLGLFRIGRLAV